METIMNEENQWDRVADADKIKGPVELFVFGGCIKSTRKYEEG